jgi:myo-inositol-1(or 4)-monophosphatase
MEATPKVWDIAGAWVILQAAGGTWISLEDAPFPLLSGLDYGDRSFPTLVISDTKVESTFGPFVVSAGYRIPVNSHYSYH